MWWQDHTLNMNYVSTNQTDRQHPSPVYKCFSAGLPARLERCGKNGSKWKAAKAYWSYLSIWKAVHWTIIVLGCVSVNLHKNYRDDFSHVRLSQFLSCT